jgi:hypothetical protein
LNVDFGINNERGYKIGTVREGYLWEEEREQRRRRGNMLDEFIHIHLIVG